MSGLKYGRGPEIFTKRPDIFVRGGCGGSMRGGINLKNRNFPRTSMIVNDPYATNSMWATLPAQTSVQSNVPEAPEP